MSRDILYVCKECRREHQRRRNSPLDLACLDCGGFLKRKTNTKQEIKFENARKEIQQIYAKIDCK